MDAVIQAKINNWLNGNYDQSTKDEILRLQKEKPDELTDAFYQNLEFGTGGMRGRTIGVTTAATIVGAFVFGVPSIIAVVINYVKRSEARGTFLESHFRWQIRTFWFAFLWCVVGGMLFVTLVGIPLAIGVFFAAGVWAIYRIARGWLALRDRKPMYK